MSGYRVTIFIFIINHSFILVVPYHYIRFVLCCIFVIFCYHFCLNLSDVITSTEITPMACLAPRLTSKQHKLYDEDHISNLVSKIFLVYIDLYY